MECNESKEEEKLFKNNWEIFVILMKFEIVKGNELKAKASVKDNAFYREDWFILRVNCQKK